MFKQAVTFFLIGLILNLTFSSTAYTQTQTKEEKRITKMKKMLSLIEDKLDGEVEIRLLDKTKVIGKLQNYDNDSLTIVEKDTGKVSKFQFSQVNYVNPWASKKRFIISLLIIAGFVGFLVNYGKNF